jgi:predicted flap endonuclease-1-like 5' DNA nuclease
MAKLFGYRRPGYLEGVTVARLEKPCLAPIGTIGGTTSRKEMPMTDLPKIPASAVAVLERAGVRTLEDCAMWPAEELAALRGFGPKAFRTVEAAMMQHGFSFDPSSPKRAEPVNRAMAEERMKGVVEPAGPSNLPNIGRPATSALAQIGVRNVIQLAGYSEREILALHGVGPKAIRILRPVMDEMGVAFRNDD